MKVTKYVMVCIGLAGFQMSGQEDAPVGQYLVDYDPDSHDGFGFATWTHDLDEAKQFDSNKDAALCWQQVSKRRPKRFDGKANRPLMAYSIDISPVDFEVEDG